MDIKYEVYFAIPTVPKPPLKMVTLQEKKRDSTAFNLLHAVNSVVNKVNIHLVQNTVNEFGDIVPEDVVVTARPVDMWLHVKEADTFMGAVELSNDSYGLILVKKV